MPAFPIQQSAVEIRFVFVRFEVAEIWVLFPVAGFAIFHFFVLAIDCGNKNAE